MRVSVNPEMLEVKSCRGSIIKEIKIFNVEMPQAPIYWIKLRESKKGTDKLSLYKPHPNYIYNYDSLLLNEKSVYQIIIPNNHTIAKLYLYTGEKGEVISVKNNTPCLKEPIKGIDR